MYSLLSNGLRQPSNTSLRQRIVDLSRISMQARCRRNIDDIPLLAILDSEVRCSGANNLKRCGTVESNNSVPLLIRHFVDNAIPCITRVVYDYMDLPIAEFSSLLDEGGNVGIVEDVAYYGDCRAAGGVD
jgi:hypothetical protein